MIFGESCFLYLYSLTKYRNTPKPLCDEMNFGMHITWEMKLVSGNNREYHFLSLVKCASRDFLRVLSSY